MVCKEKNNGSVVQIENDVIQYNCSASLSLGKSRDEKHVPL